MAKQETVRTRELSHEEWVEAFDRMLLDRHVTLFGRAYDILHPSSRAECARWLADAAFEAGSSH